MQSTHLPPSASLHPSPRCPLIVVVLLVVEHFIALARQHWRNSRQCTKMLQLGAKTRTETCPPPPSRSLSHCLASLSRSLQRAHQQLARGDFNETRRWAPIAAIKINYSICQLCGATVAHQMCPGRGRERGTHTEEVVGGSGREVGGNCQGACCKMRCIDCNRNR